MPTSINGIPLHPLVVHAVVVLVPLVAIGAIVIAFVPRWRVRYGIPLVLLAAGAAGASMLAKETGEQLEEQVAETATLETHTELGDTFFVFAGILLVTLTALVAVQWWRERSIQQDSGGVGPVAGETSGSDTARAASSGALMTVLAALTVIAAVVATVQIVRVGDTGAQSVWSDATGSSAGSSDTDDD